MSRPELSIDDFNAVVRFLVAQPTLRHERTGKRYVPTGFGDGLLRLSPIDEKPKKRGRQELSDDQSIAVSTLEGFTLAPPRPEPAGERGE